MIVRIVREWDDYDPVTLGYVETTTEDREEIEKTIREEFSAFQDTEPSSDGEFIEWLCESTGWSEYESGAKMEVVLD